MASIGEAEIAGRGFPLFRYHEVEAVTSKYLYQGLAGWPVFSLVLLPMLPNI